MTRRALVTGATGQDGTYLAEMLRAKGWEVWGTAGPRGSAAHPHIPAERLLSVNLSNADASAAIVTRVDPEVVFHFAGISSVGYSWDNPVETVLVNGTSAVSVLNALLHLQDQSGIARRFVNASSAEIFAGSNGALQNEDTPITPLSPYGASKAFSHNMVQVFRHRGLHASNAIFFNHESPLRETRFVTRKITSGVAAIAAGKQDLLELGNLEARRDWGWAPDYAYAAFLMSQSPAGGDYVIATGESHSVKDFVDTAFRAAGIDNWSQYVATSEQFTRPTDSAVLVGDAAKANRELGWVPTKRFDDVVVAMVEHDLELARGQKPI